MVRGESVNELLTVRKEFVLLFRSGCGIRHQWWGVYRIEGKSYAKAHLVSQSDSWLNPRAICVNHLSIFGCQHEIKNLLEDVELPEAELSFFLRQDRIELCCRDRRLQPQPAEKRR